MNYHILTDSTFLNFKAIISKEKMLKNLKTLLHIKYNFTFEHSFKLGQTSDTGFTSAVRYEWKW